MVSYLEHMILPYILQISYIDPNEYMWAVL